MNARIKSILRAELNREIATLCGIPSADRSSLTRALDALDRLDRLDLAKIYAR
jgi:hypothetical protein